MGRKKRSVKNLGAIKRKSGTTRKASNVQQALKKRGKILTFSFDQFTKKNYGRITKTRKSGSGIYRIKYDHKVNGRFIRFPQNKDEAMRWIRADLSQYPHVKASLQKAKEPFGSGWKAHSTFKWRYNRKTKKHRLIKL